MKILTTILMTAVLSLGVVAEDEEPLEAMTCGQQEEGIIEQVLEFIGFPIPQTASCPEYTPPPENRSERG